MDTPVNYNRAALCSVTEMAQRLGLSRARFYQLLDNHAFPPPIRSATQRSFYPPDLQQKCIEIRRTGIGVNGQPVLFNRRRKGRKSRSVQEGKYDRFVAALKNMGLESNANAVEQAVHVLYPAGLEGGHDPNKVLLELARHFAKDCQEDV